MLTMIIQYRILVSPDLDSVLASFGISAEDFERITIEQLAKMELK